MMRLRGLTMVELLTAVGLSSMVFLIVMTTFVGGLRTLGRGERSAAVILDALGAAELIVSELETAFVDLQEAHTPVVIDSDGRGMSFYRADPGFLDWSRVRGIPRRIEAVRMDDGHYTVQVDGRTASSSRLADLRFEFFPADGGESGGVHIIRVLLWSAEGGLDEPPLVVVKALELPTLVFRERRLQEIR